MAKPKSPKSSPVAHFDGWQSLLTGLGYLERDKRLSASFLADRITQERAEEIWLGDDIAARIVETIPEEMTRVTPSIVVAGEPGLSEDLDEALRNMHAIEEIQRALCHQRAFGGAAILLGADDGQADLSKPLDESRIRSFTWLSERTPRELVPVTWYGSVLDARYSQVETWRLVPYGAVTSLQPGEIAGPVLHESRIIKLEGITTSRRALVNGTATGWGHSIFVRILQVIQDFQVGWQGAGIILTDFSTPTLKLKGLAEALALAGEAQRSLVSRAAAMELSRSIARVTLLDSEEEYERHTTQVTGLAELLEKFFQRVASAAQMPVSMLTGQAPAGLNATGDSEMRWFYDRVRSKQMRDLLPIWKRLATLVFLSKEGPTGGKIPENWSIKIPPLWQLTDKEQAEARKVQADSDAIYIDRGVVTPEEIAISRFGGDEYSFETQIDAGLRAEMTGDTEQQRAKLESVGQVPADDDTESDDDAPAPKA